MSQRVVYERGAPCEIENCGSKEYVETDGQWFCRNGHLQARLFAHGDEDPTISSQGRRARKKGEAREKTTTIVTGQPAIELYLQCYQLILWKQAHWLVNDKRFPSELESIVRDLWTLRLQMLQALLEKPDEVDRASQMFSSQSDDGQTDNEDDAEGSHTLSKLQKRIPRLVETLGICYIALLLLRLPISLGDIRDWVENEEILYIHAFKAIPKKLKRNMPQSFRGSFQPSIGVPELSRLHLVTSSLSHAFRKSSGMILPALNHLLLLFRFLTDLSLPLEVFPTVTRLAKLIQCDFTFPSTTKKYEHISNHPELQLVSLLMVATKLLYPFDSTTRSPITTAEPAAMAIDWQVWEQARKQLDLTPITNKGTKDKRSIEMTEQDVFSMKDKQIDKYLDWFSDSYLDQDLDEQDHEADFRRAVYGLFPIDRKTGTSALNTTERDAPPLTADTRKLKALRKVQRALIEQEVVSNKQRNKHEGVRPGGRYAHYRNKNELPASARPFFEAAARLVSLPLDGLLVSVFQVEIRLEHSVKHQGKRQKKMTDTNCSYESASEDESNSVIRSR